MRLVIPANTGRPGAFRASQGRTTSASPAAMGCVASRLFFVYPAGTRTVGGLASRLNLSGVSDRSSSLRNPVPIASAYSIARSAPAIFMTSGPAEVVSISFMASSEVRALLVRLRSASELLVARWARRCSLAR
nr:hypothetical protein [Aquisphaera giovannonii]